MPQPSYNVHGTAITAYAIAWGFLLKLGEKGILSRQEIVDSLDLALVFVEDNAKHFDDPMATDAARRIVESLMKTVSQGGGTRKTPGQPDNEPPPQ
jgi:hypothetical protein